MANRLKKIMQPILKQKCSESFQAGYRKGLEDGWKRKLKAYENDIQFKNTVINSLEAERVRLLKMLDDK